MIYPPSAWTVERAVENGSLVLPGNCSASQFAQQVANFMRENPGEFFIPNDTPTTTSIVAITDENRSHLCHGLVSFPADYYYKGCSFPLYHQWFEIEPPQAKWLKFGIDQQRSKSGRGEVSTPTGHHVVAGFRALPSECEPPPLLQLLVTGSFYRSGLGLGTDDIERSRVYWSTHAEIRKPSRPA